MSGLSLCCSGSASCLCSGREDAVLSTLNLWTVLPADLQEHSVPLLSVFYPFPCSWEAVMSYLSNLFSVSFDSDVDRQQNFCCWFVSTWTHQVSESVNIWGFLFICVESEWTFCFSFRILQLDLLGNKADRFVQASHFFSFKKVIKKFSDSDVEQIHKPEHRPWTTAVESLPLLVFGSKGISIFYNSLTFYWICCSVINRYFSNKFQFQRF